jgi:hypothetical protein
MNPVIAWKYEKSIFPVCRAPTTVPVLFDVHQVEHWSTGRVRSGRIVRAPGRFRYFGDHVGSTGRGVCRKDWPRRDEEKLGEAWCSGLATGLGVAGVRWKRNFRLSRVLRSTECIADAYYSAHWQNSAVLADWSSRLVEHMHAS